MFKFHISKNTFLRVQWLVFKGKRCLDFEKKGETRDIQICYKEIFIGLWIPAKLI